MCKCENANQAEYKRQSQALTRKCQDINYFNVMDNSVVDIDQKGEPAYERLSATLVIS
jgi:hypothetical protein